MAGILPQSCGIATVKQFDAARSNVMGSVDVMWFRFSPSGRSARLVTEHAGFSYDDAARHISRGRILSAGVLASLAIGIAATASSLDPRPPRPETVATSVPLAHDHARGRSDVDGRG